MGTGLMNRKGPCPDITVVETVVNGRICGALAKFDINQVYRNSGAGEMDTVYRLILPPCAFVTGFDATKKREKVHGFIMEKDLAKTACEKPDGVDGSSPPFQPEDSRLLEFAVGLIPPGETVNINISYIQELKFCHNQLTVIVPAFWSPNSVIEPSAGHPGGQEGLKSKVALTMSVDLLGRVSDLHSSSHSIKVDRLSETESILSLSDQHGLSGSDFILHCTCREEESAGGVYCSGGGTEGVVYLNFVPRLPSDEESGAGNYIFLLDNSDAMTGERFAQAKHALNTILRSLSEIDTFKIAAFAGNLSPFSGGGSLPFAQASLDRAAEWIESLTPTAGEANIFKAVRYALSSGGGKKKHDTGFDRRPDGHHRRTDQLYPRKYRQKQDLYPWNGPCCKRLFVEKNG